MIPDANQGQRGPVAGFGWNGWEATKYGWFTLAQGGEDGLNPLRFSTHGVGDGSGGRDWGYEVKKDVAADTEYSIALSVQLGGKITVYINGKLQNEATSEYKNGYIALQSEGGPIEFRNIYLTSVE